VNNYIYEYYQKITDGTIIVGRWIKVWYKYVVDGLEKGLFHFDSKKAQKAIRFVENFCRHHEGALAPQLIVLELWQKALLSVLFGVMDDTDHRQFREVVVIIARKTARRCWPPPLLPIAVFWMVSTAGASTLPRLSWNKRGCATTPIIRCSARTQS
jgi:hypothetical protein